jgi:hypothetical protein
LGQLLDEVDGFDATSDSLERPTTRRRLRCGQQQNRPSRSSAGRPDVVRPRIELRDDESAHWSQWADKLERLVDEATA